MEPLFKVGDKVRIKKRTGGEYEYKFTFTDEMAKYAGAIVTIKSVEADYYCGDKCKVPDDNALYTLKELQWSWSSGMLEKVSSNSPLIVVNAGKKLKLNFKL